MIRAVPVEYFISPDKSGPDHMAFLSTVTDQFMTFDGTDIWENFDDLKEVADKEFCDRVMPLCPEWFL